MGRFSVMRSRIRKFTLVGCLAVCASALSLAAAQSSASAPSKDPRSALTPILNQVKGLKPAARERKLYALARQEGTLEWYTSMSSPISEPVEKAFEAKYAGVQVNRYRASSEAVTQRIVQEARAGTSGADVVETNGTEMLTYQNAGNILIPYTTSPYRKTIPKFGRFVGFTADRIEHFVVAWNTNLVSAADRPKTYEDLANEKWKGKIAMEPTDVDWWYGLSRYLRTKAKWSQARIDRMFRGMASNALIVPSHTTQVTLLAAGQFAICVSCHSHSTKDLIEKGAPLAFRPLVQPVTQRPQGVGIVQRLKHPAAALLFYDWLLTKSGGQTALAQNHVDPARKDMVDPAFRSAKIWNINIRTVVSRFNSLSKDYDELMRLGKKR
jgi:iron(III) transport system substrate-binding protein